VITRNMRVGDVAHGRSVSRIASTDARSRDDAAGHATTRCTGRRKESRTAARRRKGPFTTMPRPACQCSGTHGGWASSAALGRGSTAFASHQPRFVMDIASGLRAPCDNVLSSVNISIDSALAVFTRQPTPTDVSKRHRDLGAVSRVNDPYSR